MNLLAGTIILLLSAVEPAKADTPITELELVTETAVEPETTVTAVEPEITETIFESTPATSCKQPADPFCFTVLAEGHCKTACCSLPYCEGGIDWEYCVSCFQCRCLPPPTETSPTAITETTACEIQCEYQPGCTVHMNSDSCRCEYDCTTTRSTLKPKKMKCWPLT